MNWVYFEQIMVKSTQFEQNWMLFFRNWYSDGWIIVRNIDKEKVKFSRSGRYIHVPPPGVAISGFGLDRVDRIRTSSDFNENQPMEGRKYFIFFNFVSWYPNHKQIYPKVTYFQNIEDHISAWKMINLNF